VHFDGTTWTASPAPMTVGPFFESFHPVASHDGLVGAAAALGGELFSK
jgi:hypothetical protein